MKIYKIRNFISYIIISFLFFSIVFAIDKENVITPSNDDTSTTYFSTGSETKYFNKDSNSDIIGDYLVGYYFNVLYGFFRLDWDTINKINNVRIIGSTGKCSSGYGYKLGGFAKSDTSGFINFNYDNNNYVYYCINDKKLHGKAYIQSIGLQSFEGVSFEILPSFDPLIINTSKDTMFVNNFSNIFYVTFENQTLKYGQESIFYIWKPKIKK